MYKLKCINCKTSYESTDDDAYLCASCHEIKLQIAREVDAKVGSTVGQQPNSDYTNYNNLVKANGGKWPTASQLGIK